jgi:integrase
MKRKTSSKPETVSVGNVRVKIYQRTRPTLNGKSRAVFEVSDYTSGARCLRSFTHRTDARNEAVRIARQLASGDATAASMLNSEAASFGRGVELLKPTGASLEMACATFAKCFEILGSDALTEAAKFYARHRADQVTRKRVADVVVELVAAKEARRKSASYVRDLRIRLTRFAEAFAVDISSVTTSDVQKFLDRLKLAPQSVKNYRRVLYTLFQFAEARNYVFKGGNPVTDTETISAVGGDIQIFTPDEVAALLKAATPDFLPLVAIGGFAGLRAAEAQRIEWSNIDLAGGFIHIGGDKAKTKSRRLVPVQPNLAAWLATYAQHSGKIWNGTANDLYEARTACVKTAGVKWKTNGLRHSYASYRLADIQNAAQVALEMGNSPDMVFRHYREIVKPPAAKAWFAVAPEAAANVIRLKTA